MLLASIDIGTNSVRLLVAEFKNGKLQPRYTRIMITRLGQGVDDCGRISREAMERTVEVLAEYRQVLAKWAVKEVVVIATSAVRDAQNRQEFIDFVQERTGWELQVLSGSEEAQLSFLGALAVLASTEITLPELLVVVDIGGGSTELMLGTNEGKLIRGDSAQVGAVRMTEKFLPNQPVNADDLVAMEQEVCRLLQPVVDKVGYPNPMLIGVGGTATTIAAMLLELSTYDPQKVTGFRIKKEQVEKLYKELASLPLPARSKLAGLQPGREDIIVAGCSILVQVMSLLNASELVVCDGDLLQGALYRIVTTNCD